MSEYTLLIKADTPEIRALYEGHGAVHKGDSGVDVFCHEDQRIKFSGEKIKFGIHCQMVKTLPEYAPVPVSYILIPRSSISKTPLRMSNSVGLIDADYTGELMAPVDLLENTSLPFHYTVQTPGFFHDIKKGTRLFQIVAPGFVPFTIKLVDELRNTERGSGGFGSSGSGTERP